MSFIAVVSRNPTVEISWRWNSRAVERKESRERGRSVFIIALNFFYFQMEVCQSFETDVRLESV